METTRQKVEAYLVSKGFKNKGNSWDGNCPWRADADSKSFRVTFGDDEHGAWVDRTHNESGSLYEFCQRVGIALPERTLANDTKRGYTGLEDYARAHWAPLEAFVAAKWQEGAIYGRPAISFPTANGVRYRCIDGQKPPFINEKGYTSCWYGIGRAISVATEMQSPIVLTNGEASVVVGQYWGVPALAVTSGSEKKLADHLLAELKVKWGGKRIIIALDCDDTGRKAAQDLAAQLTENEFVVSVVDLMLTDKGDLCDFCGLYERGAFAELQRRATFKVQTKADTMLLGLQALQPELAKLDRLLANGDRKSPTAIEQLEKLYARIGNVLRGMPSNVRITGDQMADMLAVRYSANDSGGLDTGLRLLDERRKGFRAGIHIVLGATGMGKSTFMQSVAGHMIKTGHRVLIMPTEMDAIQWATGVCAYLLGVTTDVIEDKRLTPEQQSRYGDVLELVQRNTVFVTSNRVTIAGLQQHIDDARQTGALDAVIIDSMSNLMGQYGDNFAMQGHHAYGELIALRSATNVPFFVTHQIDGRKKSAESDNIKLPNMYDAKGSSGVEDAADTLMFIYYHHYYVLKGFSKPDDAFPEGTAHIGVLKVRGRAAKEDVLIPVKLVRGQGFYNLR